MTELIHMTDPYAREAGASVTAHVDGGLMLDRVLFYARSGGQPGDSGHLAWNGGSARVTDCVKAEDGPVLLLAEGDPVPPVGSDVVQTLDWERRHAHMRVHTALHLLSVVIPLPVTGGAITAEKGRLDFDMEEAPDKDRIESALNALIERDLEVTDNWITDEELAANPGLVKTMSVQPPMGQGRVRLVRIGTEEEQVDLQPCGGTHVARTGEIGAVHIGKIEKKGRQNRRVNVVLGPRP